LALLLLPVTSLPLLAKRIGGIIVAPPSSFLFLLLALIWLIPYIWRGGKLPQESWPLLVFVAIVAISWGWSLLGDVPPFRNSNPLKEGIQAIATLALGLASFFVPAAWLLGDRQRLRRSLQIITLGGLILIIWSLVQAWFVLYHDSEFPFRLIQFQRLFSSRGNDPLIAGRATGFAYEPSWLAHQLNMIYLPLWLAATIRGYSAFPKLWRVSLENILLPAGVFVLFISFSRIGWLAMLLVIIVVTIWISWRVGQALIRRFLPVAQSKTWLRVVFSMILTIVMLAIYIWGMWQLVQIGARYEPRLERILNRNILEADNIYIVFNNLEFAERVIYWATGMRTFSEHWLLGVGIGNSGFYFPLNMPRFGWWLTEMTDLLNRFSFQPNIKNIWVRLLAETGIAGFAVFISWYVLLFRAAWVSWRSDTKLVQAVGLMGIFTMIAFLADGFSIDSFALPYLWLAAGLILAARSLATQDVETSP